MSGAVYSRGSLFIAAGALVYTIAVPSHLSPFTARSCLRCRLGVTGA